MKRSDKANQGMAWTEGNPNTNSAGIANTAENNEIMTKPKKRSLITSTAKL